MQLSLAHRQQTPQITRHPELAALRINRSLEHRKSPLLRHHSAPARIIATGGSALRWGTKHGKARHGKARHAKASHVFGSSPGQGINQAAYPRPVGKWPGAYRRPARLPGAAGGAIRGYRGGPADPRRGRAQAALRTDHQVLRHLPSTCSPSASPAWPWMPAKAPSVWVWDTDGVAMIHVVAAAGGLPEPGRQHRHRGGRRR